MDRPEYQHDNPQHNLQDLRTRWSHHVIGVTEDGRIETTAGVIRWDQLRHQISATDGPRRLRHRDVSALVLLLVAEAVRGEEWAENNLRRVLVKT